MRFLIGISLFIFLFSIIAVKADDLNVDLGRHILSGEIIVNTHNVPSNNYFSYTNPDAPFINHYWLTEVIFYLLTNYLGLSSLLILKLLLIVTSIGIISYFAYKQYGIIASSLATFLVIPIFIVRNAIRPELFGYLFFSILLVLLLNYPKSKKYFFLIPFILLLWINLSITFVYGVFFVLLLFLKYCLEYKNQITKVFKQKPFLYLLAGLAVLLINPQGLRGVFEPYSLLSSNVFTISEMQNIFTAVRTHPHPIYTYIMYLLGIALCATIYLAIKRKYVLSFVLFVFLIMSTLQNRNISFFIFISIPAFAFVIKDLFAFIKERYPQIKNYKTILSLLFACSILIASIPFFTNSFYKTFDTKQQFGFGYYEDLLPGIQFLQKNKLQKNVFNNFDISGYFIYKTFPEYKPFMDNRPEAYPSNFVENEYLAAFNNVDTMNHVVNKYKINSVILQLDSGDQEARHMTNQLYKDKKWRLVYLDGSTVIFTKDRSIKDIRDNISILRREIEATNDYLVLGKYASNLALIEQMELVEIALQKANELNPDSCNMKRLFNESYIGAGDLLNADTIKNKYWYCFSYL